MSTAARRAVIAEHLKTLKMPSFAREYEARARQARDGQWDYEEYLCELLEIEVLSRQQRTAERRLREAQFPDRKTLDQIDWKALNGISKPKLAELASGAFLEAAEDVVFAGPIGTGKTHLAIALGIEATRRRFRVLFRRASELVRELVEARDEHELGSVDFRREGGGEARILARPKAQHEAAAGPQRAPDLGKLRRRIGPEINRMDGVGPVEVIVREGQGQAVGPLQADLAGPDRRPVSPPGLAQHGRRGVDAGHPAVTDFRRRPGDGAAMPEADFQDLLARGQIKAVKRPAVLRRGLARHDRPDQLAQQAVRAAALGGDPTRSPEAAGGRRRWGRTGVGHDGVAPGQD